MFLRHLVPWPPLTCTKNFMEIVPGEPSVGRVKPKRGSKIYRFSTYRKLYLGNGAIRGKLELITNRKSHMSLAFDWYQNRWPWMAQWPLFCVISAKSVAFGAHRIKVVEDIPKLSVTECSPKLLVCSDISLTMIWCRQPLHRGIKRMRGSQI